MKMSSNDCPPAQTEEPRLSGLKTIRRQTHTGYEKGGEQTTKTDTS